MSPEPNKMQIGRDARPFVGFPKLSVMTEKAPRPKTIEGKVVRMTAEPKPDTGKTGRMSAFRKTTTRITGKKQFAEQKLGKVVTDTTEKEPAGYVRVRLQVRNGEVSVLSAKSVEGPLVDPKLEGDLAYEVTLGQKRVAAGAVPDVGERRSFPAPKGKGEQAGHFVTPLDSYEVNVRVPKDSVSLTALPRVEVVLYRVKEELPVARTEELRAVPLHVQFERQVREVGRLKGLQPEKHKAAAAQLRRAFK